MIRNNYIKILVIFFVFSIYIFADDTKTQVITGMSSYDDEPQTETKKVIKQDKTGIKPVKPEVKDSKQTKKGKIYKVGKVKVKPKKKIIIKKKRKVIK